MLTTFFRSIVCWYCNRGEHERCALKRACACPTCYPYSHN